MPYPATVNSAIAKSAWIEVCRGTQFMVS
jgi:hypothetical protein